VALAIGALAIAYGPDPVDAMDDDEMGEEMAVPAVLVPDRTFQVEASDTMRFIPGEITVQEGETIAFVVTNSGEAEHEFVIGDEEVQQEHEAEMAESGGEMEDEHGDEAEVEVAPGETATLVYTFDEPGELLYGCHVPGHYAAGMVGTITVEEAP
jgi:uncharacterized cupredoxin-like copper-binding protein